MCVNRGFRGYQRICHGQECGFECDIECEIECDIVYGYLNCWEN